MTRLERELLNIDRKYSLRIPPGIAEERNASRFGGLLSSLRKEGGRIKPPTLPPIAIASCSKATKVNRSRQNEIATYWDPTTSTPTPPCSFLPVPQSDSNAPGPPLHPFQSSRLPFLPQQETHGSSPTSRLGSVEANTSRCRADIVRDRGG